MSRIGLALIICLLVSFPVRSSGYENNFVKLGGTYRIDFFIDKNSVYNSGRGTKLALMLMIPKKRHKNLFNKTYNRSDVYYIMNEVEIDTKRRQMRFLNLYAFDENKNEVSNNGVGDEMKFTRYKSDKTDTVTDKLIGYIIFNYK